MTGDYNFDIFKADENDAKILLQAFSFDGTSTWGKGADKGYPVFLEALKNIEFYDIETNSDPYLNGIFACPEIIQFESQENMVDKVYQQVNSLFTKNKFLTFFGGEHSISIPIMRAYREKFNNLTILQIDAHSDLRKNYNGSEYNHACAMHEVSRHCNVVQVGIRSMDRSELQYMNQDHVYFAKDIYNKKEWMGKSIKQMSDDVYITFDLDALDPTIMPATGTPEPGGLEYYQILEYLKKVFANKNVVGFDIVEFAPIEYIHYPQNVVANLYYKMLAYKFIKFEK